MKKAWVWRILNLWVWICFFLRIEWVWRLWTRIWRILQTQPLSLEISPKSEKFFPFESEFGEFSKLSTWVWRILQTQHLSLENSPNSTSEWVCVFFKFLFFQEKWVWRIWTWVWRNLQTQPLSVCVFFNFVFFPKKMSLEILNLSLEKSPNSTLEFGEFSKLNLWVCVFFKFRFFSEKNEFGDFEPEFGEISKLNPWVWRNLQTQPLSLENSPNSTSECVCVFF